jgi:hypothetical protein
LKVNEPESASRTADGAPLRGDPRIAQGETLGAESGYGGVPEVLTSLRVELEIVAETPLTPDG